MGTYQDKRSEIRSGDLLAWSVSSLRGIDNVAPNVIRLFTRSEYNHVGIAWVVGDRVFVIEATPPMVRIFPLAKLVPFYHIPMEIEWKPDYENYLLSKVGDKYSIWQAIRSYFGKPDKDDRWQCAEFAASFYDLVKSGVVFDKITPAGVVEAILAQKDTSVERIV